MKPAALIATLALLVLATQSAAQPYPSRSIRLVIPFAPGGLVDVPGRVLAQKLSEALGQPVIVENRAGAGSTIGADHVAKSKPDGHTLLMTSTTHVISANLYRALPYDSLRDFMPIMKLTEGPYVLVVNPALKVASVAELVALARERPSRIDYGSSGNGSSQHLVAALFCTMAGAPLNHVPYKGSDRATQDLIGGQIMVGFVGTPIALPHVKSGRLRALAVTSPKRASVLADVPTFEESGIAGMIVSNWFGVFGPARLSKDVLAKLHSSVVDALGSNDVRTRMAALSLEIVASTPQAFDAHLRAELEKWGKVVKAAGIKPE